MFVGVVVIVFNEEENLISGLSFKEGEEVIVLFCVEEKVFKGGLMWDIFI